MKGIKSVVGDTRTAFNGYHYIRTEEGWRLAHHVVVEQEIGRHLREGERVVFRDRNKDNLEPSNLEVLNYKGAPKTKVIHTRADSTANLRRCPKCEQAVDLQKFYYTKDDPTRPGNRQPACRDCRIAFLSKLER